MGSSADNHQEDQLSYLVANTTRSLVLHYPQYQVRCFVLVAGGNLADLCGLESDWFVLWDDC